MDKAGSMRAVGILFKVLARFLSALSMLGVVFMLVMISMDILGRVLFNSPVPGVPEAVRLMIVCIVFLQLTHTVEVGQLIQSESLLFRLTPDMRLKLQALYELVGACALAGVFIYSWQPALYSWSSYETTPTGFINVPVFPVRIIILVGSGLTSLQFMVNAFLSLRQLFSNPEAKAQKKASDK
jgi:TRAP-type C4-dicarboxylate transport system permease small subunit